LQKAAKGKQHTFFYDEMVLRLLSTAVLPDGIFSNQTAKFGKILEGLAMKDVLF
jgi:hypothetical protein